jgi:hypothetical protein
MESKEWYRPTATLPSCAVAAGAAQNGLGAAQWSTKSTAAAVLELCLNPGSLLFAHDLHSPVHEDRMMVVPDYRLAVGLNGMRLTHVVHAH